MSDSQRGKDERQNKEYIGLNKADEELEGHEGGEADRGQVAGQEGNNNQQDFTSKGIAEQPQTQRNATRKLTD